MVNRVFYFAYGTTQRGFPTYDLIADVLGTSLGRFRTAVPHQLVVARRPACSNPGCRLVHRMCGLLPGRGGDILVEGDLFDVGPAALDVLDKGENYRSGDEAGSTYLRRPVLVFGIDQQAESIEAQAYFIADAGAWRRLLARGDAETVERYTLEMADGGLKQCCRRNPGHAGPHDVIDVFAV